MNTTTNPIVTVRNNVTLEAYTEAMEVHWNSRTEDQKNTVSAWDASVRLERELEEADEIRVKLEKATKGRITAKRSPYTYDQTNETFGELDIVYTATDLRLASWSTYDWKKQAEAFLIGASFGRA